MGSSPSPPPAAGAAPVSGTAVGTGGGCGGPAAGGAAAQSTQVLFYEGFEDAVLETSVNESSGDTLFALGCGLMFEGTPAQFWSSLSTLRTLPADTRVYCGHEYTQSNARFALSVDGGNAKLKARAAEIDRLRAAGKPTVPSILGDELDTNPFLRADDPAMAAAVGMAGADPVAVFAEIRKRKDSF